MYAFRSLSALTSAVALIATSAFAQYYPSQPPPPPYAPYVPPSAPPKPPSAMAPDTMARLLAGMDPNPSAEGSYLQDDPTLVQHRRDFLRIWERQDGGRLSVVREWSQDAIQPRILRPRTVFYMFGGPDFLWVANAFPMADTYILAGLEPVGDVPDLRSIPPGVFEASLESIRFGMRSILTKGFYETREMREDLGRGAIHGVAPALYVFLVRTGHQIIDREFIRLDAGGNPGATGPADAQGIRITFRASAGGSTQSLYYFKTDLSDSGITSNPSFLKFLESRGQGASYLKAASYLMHGGGFDRIRNFLLTRSQCILQDDSGIPFRFFEPGAWSVTLFGNYRGPMQIFADKFQPDLRDAYSIMRPQPLPFGTGYRTRDDESVQILAVRR